MNKQDILNGLRKLQNNDHDPEIAHEAADGLLCLFLTSLGHEDIVEEWHKVTKWYA